MSSPTPLAAVLSLLAFPALSAAYSWNFKANPQQCSNLTISIAGSDGQPPYRVLIIPFGPTPLANNVEARTILDVPFEGNSNTISFQLKYPANSQLVAVVSFLLIFIPSFLLSPLFPLGILLSCGLASFHVGLVSSNTSIPVFFLPSSPHHEPGSVDRGDQSHLALIAVMPAVVTIIGELCRGQRRATIPALEQQCCELYALDPFLLPPEHPRDAHDTCSACPLMTINARLNIGYDKLFLLSTSWRKQ